MLRTSQSPQIEQGHGHGSITDREVVHGWLSMISYNVESLSDRVLEPSSPPYHDSMWIVRI